MELVSNRKLKSWEIQPIHNYFLLAAADSGFFFGFSLLGIFSFVFYKLILNIKKLKNINAKILHLYFMLIISCFFIMMMVDHYFYTIEPTKILFWFLLGLSLRISGQANTEFTA